MRIAITIVMIAVMMTAVPTAQAQKAGFRSDVQRLDYEIKVTDLIPVFPKPYACEPIASAWGSRGRFDNSTRPQIRNSGLHGGIDLSLKEGTPLLAIAAGKVIAKGEGGTLEGIFLWMQHEPEDTGLPYRAITKYQHLSELPKLNVGDRIAVGQVVASSGMTGTVGPAFGLAGYPHLHVSMFVVPVTKSQGKDEAATISPVPPKDGKLSDPMLLFLPPSAKYEVAAEFPAAEKQVPVAVTDRNGQFQPVGSKVVWPVYCSQEKL